MSPRFGTDGLRGRVDTAITEELATRLGRAAAHVLDGGRWCIGRDTRESGPRLEAAVAEGLAAEGATVELLGVLPTPAIALLAKGRGANAVVVSASHNPWFDNGLKLFGPGGNKLDDATEAAIEARMDELSSIERTSANTVGATGSISSVSSGATVYAESVVSALGGRTLEGISLVLDCGHGAASAVAADVFERLGATVEVLHDKPDGRNINDGVGSTDPSVLSSRVVELKADLGLAFDGDADRLIAVDAGGEIVDGDRLMCLFALDLRERDELNNSTLVVTVMSNLGLQRAMDDAGIRVVVTPVGDRHVLASLRANEYSLGGEQSGHIIFADVASTGDGILAGAMLADLVKRSPGDLATLAAAVMTRFPQVLVNVEVVERRADIAEVLASDVRLAQRTLGKNGRVLLRPSGTEPLIRVMVEAESVDIADAVANHLAAAVARRYGRHPSR
jgi:phosphoglucosamine mutase